MPVARCRAAAALLVACLVLSALAGCGEEAPTGPARPSLAEFRGQTMGTTYTVKVVTPQRSPTASAALSRTRWRRNVIKVIWGNDWDPLLAADNTGQLIRRMGEVGDGQYQKYTVMPGSYIRQHFFGKYPELLELVKSYSDEKLIKMRRGGHDPEKVHAAYEAAVNHTGQPTVILAKTVKGYGLGEAGEGRNITHQQKKLNEKELREFRARFGIPISDEEIAETPFFRPGPDSHERKYLLKRRKELGGFLPARNTQCPPVQVPRVLTSLQSSTRDPANDASTPARTA